MSGGQTLLDLTTTALEMKGLSVSSAVKTLADFSFASTSTAAPKRAIITSVTDGIMVSWDGTNPTSTLGHACPVNQTIVVQGSRNISNLKMIRVTTDAAVTITLEG
jgi:hypothetical protein